MVLLCEETRIARCHFSLWHCHLVSRAPASPAGGGCVLLAAAPTLTVPPLVFGMSLQQLLLYQVLDAVAILANLNCKSSGMIAGA